MTAPKQTAEQKRLIAESKKKIEVIFEKYRAQGLLDYKTNRKTCFGGALTAWGVIVLEAQALTGQTQKNFSINLSMKEGVDFCDGLTRTLLTFRGKIDPINRMELLTIRNKNKSFQKFQDKDKWISFFTDLISEIEKETAVERFLWRKEIGLI